jgi:YidC/Oxa1 family membrane protein insertase
MDRKTWVAIGLSALILLGWQKFILEKYQHPQTPAVATESAAPANAANAPVVNQSTTAATPARVEPAPAIAARVRHGELAIGNGAKVFEKWSYQPHDVAAQKDLAVDMSALVGQLPQLDITVDAPDYSLMSALVGTTIKRSETEYQWAAESSFVKLVRDVKVSPQEGFADVTFTVEFKKARPNFAFVSLVSTTASVGGEQRDHNLVYFAGKQHQSVAASEPVKLTDILLPVEWIGVEDRYFILSVVDRAGNARGLLQPLAGEQNRISLVYPVSANTTVVPVRVYFGPKSVDLLKTVHPSLDHAVDFGWLTPLAYGILHFMKWLFSFLGNYGVAIIVLTVVLKILLYPLTYKSMKSMKKMAAIQPQLQKLRDRYKDDKEALNREMLQLMRTQGYNPVAGCLPMLIQMPVFFALYRVLYSSFELYLSPFALWIHDLSKHDPWYVTPVLLTAVMFLQQKLTPNTATDPAQQKMIQWMPVIFGVFMLGLPAGLTIYMLTNAVVSIIQQIILNKKLGIYPAHAAKAG